MRWLDHFFDVPLDHDDPSSGTIKVYARELNPGADLPVLLFLQGGPGMRAERPTSGAVWIDSALSGYRILLLDQRGTGRSTPANRQSLARFGDPKAQAGYLRHFRADSIVRDAELIRQRLIGDKPWSVLGQSYGGFCAVTYLSFAPQGLREVMITGGLPSLTATADEVYRAAYPRVLAHNERFYQKYPGDRDVVRRVLSRLREGAYPLTPQRFRMVGTMLGHSLNFDNLHFMLEDAFTNDGELSDAFLYDVDDALTHVSYPLYAVMHESIYCQQTASGWAAQRVLAEFGEFAEDETNLHGEMVFPFMFDEDPILRPLKGCAEELAAIDDWPVLYDPQQLARNTVPVAAAIYYDDMYVDREHSVRTASGIRGLQPWITNEYAHNGLRLDARVFDRLHSLLRG